jgi:hypothetical protein
LLLCAAALAGCATGKHDVQEFVGCLKVGMPMEQMEKVCVPGLKKPLVYLRSTPKLFHDEVRSSCAQTTVVCEPSNLPQLLHLDYSAPATKDQSSVQEPHALVRTEMIGIGGQAVMIFYDANTGRIIGWVAKGLWATG